MYIGAWPQVAGTASCPRNGPAPECQVLPTVQVTFPTPLQTNSSAVGEHDPILLHVGTRRTHYKSWQIRLAVIVAHSGMVQSTSSNLRKLQKETDAFAMYPSGRLICLLLGVFLELTTTLVHLS